MAGRVALRLTFTRAIGGLARSRNSVSASGRIGVRLAVEPGDAEQADHALVACDDDEHAVERERARSARRELVDRGRVDELKPVRSTMTYGLSRTF